MKPGRSVLIGSFVVAATMIASASVGAAGPSWTIQPTPNRSPHLSELLGVSCPSTTACTAVGGTVGPDVPLAERWNGSTWAIQATPNAGGSGDTEFTSVSCPSVSNCIAVGFAEPPSGTTAFAETWNGTRWSVDTIPNPPGTSFAMLNGVSCASSTACTAVGIYDVPTGVTALAERWNGSTWTVQSTAALPAAANFAGVSCTSISLCTAVGSFDDGSAGLMPLAARWNGTTWSAQSVPNPSGTAGGRLTAVSCPSATACTAVGLSRTGGGVNRYLAERWNGSAWTVQAIVNPSHANLNQLNAVSCATVSGCTAVGTFVSKKGTLTLAEGWNGSTWAIQTTANAASRTQSLEGVSCVPTAMCTAVGTYKNASGSYDTLAERRS
jgi:hypothetical protein